MSTRVPQQAGVSAVNLPNALTVLRLLVVPCFVVTLLIEDGNSTGWRLITAALFGVAAVTDFIDGDLARRHGQVTTFGKVADPIADKALIGTAFIGLSLLGEIPWWVTILVLAREIGVTLLRFAVIRHGVIPASRGGKAKTLAQMLALALYLLPLPDAFDPLRIAVLVIAVMLTVVTGVDYVFRAWTLRRDAIRAGRAAVTGGADA